METIRTTLMKITLIFVLTGLSAKLGSPVEAEWGQTQKQLKDSTPDNLLPRVEHDSTTSPPDLAIRPLWNEASPPEIVSPERLKEITSLVFPSTPLPILDETLRRRGFHYSGKTERGSFRYELAFLNDRYGVSVDL